MAEREKILEVRDLNISFRTDSGIVNAIRGVNLDLYKGETIAIVGESGSGKSVTTKAIMGIMAGNGSIDGGSINYTWTDENTGERITKDICQLSEKEMQSEIRGRKIAMVFQDPMTSLNPTMTIGNQIMEPMIHHYNTPKEEAYKKAVELLQLVGITNAEKRMKNYPHQLSGGMRQRIVIAIALSCDPYMTLIEAVYPLVTLFFFSLGVGLLLAAATVFFRDIMHIWSVFITALLYFSAIFYDPTQMTFSIGGFNMQQIIKLNPMYWYITGFRRTVMWGIPLDFNMFAVCGCCAVLSMLVGVWVFRKTQDRFVLHI